MSARYHWFGPVSTQALRELLNAASRDAQLQVHQDGQAMTLHVVEPSDVVTEGGGGGVNDSHVCPPDCG